MAATHVRLTGPLALMLAALLAGCASGPLAPGAPEPTAAARPLPPVTLASDSAAAALLQAADQARARQDRVAASRYLERALNVAQPDEETILYRAMAELRLEDGDPAAARGLAQRALRTAPDHPEWKLALWRLIEEASSRLGDRAGVRAAREQSEALQSLRRL